MVCAVDHRLETDCAWTAKSESSDNTGSVVFSFHAHPEIPIKIVKFMAYHTSHDLSFKELVVAAGQTLEQGMSRGFEDLLAGQRRCLDDFWDRSNVEIEGDPRQEHRAGELQQALRLNLFQIYQASGKVEDGGIPAKALTSQAYDGNYFWDTETYLLPFLTYTAPEIARNLLRFRYRMLNMARQRAGRSAKKAPCFPGERSTARRPRPTTRRARPSITSMPTSCMRCKNTSR